MFNSVNASRGWSKGGRGGRGGGRGRGGAHPPWLKGKDIGLYYRDRAKIIAETREENAKILQLNPSTEKRISTLMDFRKSGDKLFNRDLNRPSFTGNENKFEDMYTHINDSQFKRKFLNIVSGNIQENLMNSLRIKSKLERNNVLDEQFYEDYQEMLNSREYLNMLKFRALLPAYNRKQEILDLLKYNQVMLISGETGTFLFSLNKILFNFIISLFVK